MGDELQRQPGLADPRLAAERHDAACTATRPGPRPDEFGDLALAPGQRELPRRRDDGRGRRRRGERLVTQLLRELPGRGRGSDGQVTAQALAQLLVRRQGRAAIACRRKARHQTPVSTFVQRVDRRLATGPAHRSVMVAVTVRRRRAHLEQLAQSLAVRCAGLVRPLVVEPRQQLPFAERERLVHPPRVDQPRELAAVRPNLAFERDLVTARDELPGHRTERAPQRKNRAAQALPRARIEDVGPEPGGEVRPPVPTGMEREVGQQRPGAAARRRRHRLAVDYDAHRAQHAHLQHQRERSCASRPPAND